ncbi:DNA polymerase III subunit delta [Candidatus Falkowbacteria bacterium]|nr:DNA polymerase III subunit delta [Candidatus Falkowbacteria bacterium]
MVFFLYGADTFRSRRKLNELTQKYIKEVDPSGLSLNVLGPEAVSLKSIAEGSSAGSLLARKRMLVVERVFDKKDAQFFADLVKYVNANKAGFEDNIVVFWDSVTSEEKGMTKERGQLYKWLVGQKFAQEFKPMSNTELTSWVREETVRRGGDISREAAVHLVALTGSDLWQVDQELNKLVHYKLGQKLALGVQVQPDKIETEDVKNLVSGVFDEQVFALTDALSARNRSLAVKLFEEQLKGGESEEYLLHMILRQFRILVQVRQALDSGVQPRKIASELALHPFVAQKSVSQVRNFSLEQLKKINRRLIDIDYKVKTGQQKMKTGMNNLIAAL